MHYEFQVLSAVRQRLGVEPDDDSQDEIIEQMEPMEVWTHFCEWEGLLGYSYVLHKAHENIFNAGEDDETG